MNEEKIAEIIEKYRTDSLSEFNIPNLTKAVSDILALFPPDFRIEIDCPECKGKRMLIECIHCPEYKRPGNDYGDCQSKCPVIECPTCKGNKTVLSPLKAGLVGTIKEGE